MPEEEQVDPRAGVVDQRTLDPAVDAQSNRHARGQDTCDDEVGSVTGSDRDPVPPEPSSSATSSAIGTPQ